MSQALKDTPTKSSVKPSVKLTPKKSPKPSTEAKVKKTKTPKQSTNVFLRDIELNTIKKAFLKEIDVSKLKESLVEDIKETLLKEIDVSSIKEALTKEIAPKDFVSNKEALFDKQDGEMQDSDEHGKQDVKQKLIKPEPEPELQKALKPKLPAYQYGLVDGFKKDHEDIFSIYEIIMSNADDKDYSTLPLMLNDFAKKCTAHFQKEEALFTYMKALAASRSDIEKRIATEFSTEMKNISISIFNIINQSPFIPVHDDNVHHFIKDFEQLGELLKERISREEKVLYPMYESGHKVVVDIC